MSFWERFFDILGKAWLALIVFSWIYAAIFGCQYCGQGSRSEYYETIGR